MDSGDDAPAGLARSESGDPSVKYALHTSTRMRAGREPQPIRAEKPDWLYDSAAAWFTAGLMVVLRRCAPCTVTLVGQRMRTG